MDIIEAHLLLQEMAIMLGIRVMVRLRLKTGVTMVKDRGWSVRYGCCKGHMAWLRNACTLWYQEAASKQN